MEPATKAKAKPTKQKRGGKPPKRPDRPLTAAEEAFAVAYARHGVATRAFREANPTSKAAPATANGIASKMLNQPNIRLRIEALQSAMAETVTETFKADAEWIVGQFSNHARSIVTDFIEWGVDEVPRFTKKGEPICDRHGNPVMQRIPWLKAKPSAELSREQAANIAGVEIVQGQGGPPTLRLKLHDQQAALRELGKLGGHYKQEIKHEHAWIDDAKASAAAKLARLVAEGSTESVPEQPE